MSTDLEKEFIELGWELLEAKVKYYLYPQLDNLSDGDYDSKEQRYMELCTILNKPNTIQSMIGADRSRPSVALVEERILRRGDL